MPTPTPPHPSPLPRAGERGPEALITIRAGGAPSGRAGRRPLPAGEGRGEGSRSVLAAGLLLATLAATAGHAQAPDLASLFPHQAAITAPGDRFVRLELPPAVLAACRPDLSDLRIFDAAGREVPYGIDRGGDAHGDLEIVRSIEPPLIRFDRTTTGFETLPTSKVERLAMAIPAEAREGAWELVFATPVRDFARRVEIRGGNGETMVLVDEESIFRLENPTRERLRIRLPSLHDLSDEMLSVRLEGEDERFLEPTVRFEQVRRVPGRERAALPLAEIGRSSENGRTTVVLERPRGVVPDALRVVTSSPAFNRPMSVWDEGPGRAQLALGRGTVARLPTDEQAEALDLPLTPAGGDRLRVVIEDGDSPPLEGLAFEALIRAPAFLFVLPGDGTGAEQTATLRFGGARAHRPRYDRVALGRGAGDGPDAVARGRYDPSRVLPARLGPVEANPLHNPAPALAFAFGPGASLDPRAFRFRRSVQAEPSGDGLTRIVLDPVDLASVRADCADLRVVDADGRQRPYLCAEGTPVWQELTVEGPTSKASCSTYRFLPAAVPSYLDQLSLAPDAAFVDRAVRLEGETADGQVVALVNGPMRRSLGDPRPWRVDLPDLPFRAFTLEVDDGDDAPLRFRRVAGRFATAEVSFAAPAGTYSLLYGNQTATPPRYELEGIRSLVLALDPGTATLGPVEDNPAYRAISFLRGDGWQTPLLWAVIALVIVVLATLTLRLARQEAAQ